MTADPTAAGDVLAELSAKATPGAWRLFSKNGVTAVQCTEGVDVVSWGGFDDGYRAKSKHRANAALIVYAINAIRTNALVPAAEVDAAYERGLEDAAKLCEAQMDVFLSPEYALGQPSSSVAERVACAACAREIRALKGRTHD